MREIERERRARAPRDLDRIRRDHRDEARRDRERQIRERDERRRRDSGRWERDRDDYRRRIDDHRRGWHRDFDRHRRPLPPQVRPPHYRDPHRWRERYDRWRHGAHRPLPPPPPRWIIEEPLPYPDHNDYWDADDIYQIAAWVETYAYRVYSAMREELSRPTEWNLETLSLMYDVVVASRIYFDAVASQPDRYRDTLYELFNLEDAVNAVAGRVLCGPMPEFIRDNFTQVRYYVDELLWQYRLEVGDSVYAVTSASGETAHFAVIQSEFRDLGGEQIVACESYGFPWPKPHRSVVWDLRGRAEFMRADTLVIGSLNAAAEPGRGGIARLSALVVTYADGRRDDLIARARARRDDHFNSKGELILATPRDQINIPLDANREIESIFVVADSWIAADVDAVLSFALVREGQHSVIRP